MLVEEATTGTMLMPLAPAVAVLATEAVEVAKEAVVMAMEAAVEAEGTIPAPIVVIPANARICSTLTLNVCCLLWHVSTCVHVAHSYTSA